MKLPAPVKRVYHLFLRGVLRAVGLDFSWYVNFYRNWPYALPVVEPCLQRFRPRSRSLAFFRGYPLERFAKTGDLVLDIGANIGLVSSHLLRLGYVVHAYEPDARCAEFLRRRFFRIDPSRFHLHPVAVSDFDGTAAWHRGTRTTESSSILDGKPGTETTGALEVTVRSVTSVLESAGYASLILMDIEGAEYRVLEQMLTAKNLVRFGLCIAESHARKMPALEAEHGRIVEKIKRLELGERVLLDWR